MAAEGTLFKAHHTQASPCAPSRACLLTGTYQHTNRVVFNGTPLDADLTNLALEARAGGYDDPQLFGHTDTTIYTWQEGTWVTEEEPNMEQAVVSAVTHDVSEAKMTIAGVPDKPGVAAQVFRSLADRDINVDLIVQNVSDHGVTDISFTIPHDDIPHVEEVTNQIVKQLQAQGVSVDPEIARVSVIGAGMRTNPGVAAKMFEVLAEKEINIAMISTRRKSFSFCSYL